MVVKGETDMVEGLSETVFLECDSWILSCLTFAGMDCEGKELECWYWLLLAPSAEGVL